MRHLSIGLKDSNIPAGTIMLDIFRAECCIDLVNKNDTVIGMGLSYEKSGSAQSSGSLSQSSIHNSVIVLTAKGTEVVKRY